MGCQAGSIASSTAGCPAVITTSTLDSVDCCQNSGKDDCKGILINVHSHTQEIRKIHQQESTLIVQLIWPIWL